MAQRSVTVRLRAEVDGFRRGLNEAASAADRTSERFDGMSKAGAGLAAVGAALALGVGMAVKAFAEFDAQMSKVQAATMASAGEMAQLREAAINAGADTSFSAKEAGQAIEELAKAGVATTDILNGGLDGALALAAAGSLEVADAAELAATAMVQFKLSGEEIPHVADLLAAGAGKAQGSVEDIGMALKQGGLVASSFGISIDETVGTLAAFASAGLLGSDAGTSLKTSLLMLANPSKESAAKMRELGINAYDAQGNFVGMAKLAGNLQGALGDLTQEQRNAALAQIFGSDAIRVANILYEQGQKGIEDWTEKVNEAGYAALTASVNQNNLQGDFEKLTGSIDSVFLKSGSAANDVLRSMAQGLEDIVDVIGSTPTPLMNLAVGLAGVTSAVALVSGGLLTAIPRVVEARTAWQTFAGSNQRLASRLTTTAKVAGGAVAALAGLMILEAVTDTMRKAAPTVDTFNSALKDIKPESFNPAFQGLSADVNGVGDAFAKLSGDQVNVQMGLAISKIPGLRQNIADVKESVDGLDASMSALTKNGGLSKAGEAFKLVAQEADASAKAQGRSGMSAREVLDMMPEYKSALVDQIRELGGNAEAVDLVAVAQGKLPENLRAMADATGNSTEFQRIQKGVSEEQAEALADVGLNADGTTASLYKLLDSMYATGIATMSARDAEAAWQEALDGLQKAINEVTASQAEGNLVWDAAKGSFDLTSEAGRKASEVFGNVEDKARATTSAMANNGATQEELQAKLRESYDRLRDTAIQFGANEEQADGMARAALGIPKNVNIETAIQNYADSMAKLNGVQQKADQISGKRVPIVVDIAVNNEGALDPARYGSAAVRTAINQGPVAHAEGGQIMQYHASGGGIRPAYHAGGKLITWRPNGTDTVPVMATPGEYVIKRSSARSIGYEQLAYANATGRLPGGASGDTNLVAYIQNPFTGEYMRAQIASVAQEQMEGAARVANGRR